MSERQQFLTDLMCTAIEHYGYGFPEALEYEPDGDKPHAFIIDRYESEDITDPGELEQYYITPLTMAHGLSVIRDWPAKSEWVKDLLLSDRTNGDDGDYDVIGALAVLECALFGKVVYG